MLIEALNIDEEIWQGTTALTDSRWDPVSTQIIELVENTMEAEIREDNVASIRSALQISVAGRFSNSESEIIVAIAEDLIQPNMIYNDEVTRQRQQEAAAAVQIQERSFEEAQLIVRSGNLITELDMEALRQFGYLQPDDISILSVIGAALAMLMVTVTLGVYLERFETKVFNDLRLLSFLAVLFLTFLFAIVLFGSEGADQPYLYPSAALALLVATLVSPQLAIVLASLLAILAGITQPADTSLELSGYILIGSTAGILSLRRLDRLNNYFVAGLMISLANLVVVLAFALTAEDSPSLGTIILRGISAIGNGLFAAGIALVGLYVVTSLLNLPTNLKLLELSDSKQPLLQRLLREAPGTYQHSLQVANLSELAAEAIGANDQLIRVAAMYHDIGKMLNPFYFTENTAEGMNPHDDLNDPLKSARVIIGHVIEGDRMARRANLPEGIRDFIVEHHGTTQVLHFYNQAIENADGDESAVNIEEFTYPGPTPRSPETAIMMLADGCESATRSRRPSSKAEVEEVVNTIFELRLSEGQLDNSGLTLNDLKTIRKIFIETLQAMYHPRIAYKMREKEKPPALESGEGPPQEREKHTQITNGILKHLESKVGTQQMEPAHKAPSPILRDDDDDDVIEGKIAEMASHKSDNVPVADEMASDVPVAEPEKTDSDEK
jgi:hypothetical protein